MRRPCAFVAAALVTGTVAGNYLKLPPLLALAFLAGLIIAFVLLRRTVRVRTVLLFAVAALAGAAYLNLRTPAHDSTDISNFMKKGPQELILKGRVETPAARIPVGDDETIYRFDMKVLLLKCGAEEKPVSGNVRVYVKGRDEPPQEIQPGNVVSLPVSLYPVSRITNPGQTDYSSYYWRRNISARGYVGKNDPIEVIERTAVSWPRRALFAARQRILSGLEEAFHEKGPEKSNLLGAMLLGRWTRLEEHTKEIKDKTGTAHFLALSGLHVAIFGFFLWWTLALLPIPRNVRIAIVMAGLVCYCLIGGMRISLVRATVMGLLYLGAELFWRQRDTLNIIGAAAVIVTIINPLDVFSLGFQLSFVAVLSIHAFGPLYEKLGTIRGYLILRLQRPEERTGMDRLRAVFGDTFVAWAFVSFAAWLGVAPLVAYHFHIVTPFSILLNVLIFPGIWALLIMGIIMVACSFVMPPFAPVLAFLVSLLIGGIQTILGLFSSPPFYFYVPNGLLAPVSIPWLILYYALLAAIAWRLRHPGPRWRYIAAAGLVAASFYLFIAWGPRPPSEPTLTALDVGRGSAFVLRTSGGATILYDCGGGHKKVGKDIIAPYLWHEGVTSIDAIILSHPDADHTCAVADVLERFRVGVVVASFCFDRNRDGREMLDNIRNRGVQVRILKAGEEFEAGGARFEVLAPMMCEAFGRELSDNDTSLIVRVLDSGASFLFTGDAQTCETAMLLDSGVELGSAVFVVPHHGGKNPFVSALLQKTGASFALISGGYNQARIVAELESLPVRIISTETSGAITLQYQEGGLSVKTFIGN